ncbi:uncharacterized protein J8A68_005481 [[Candida] subhashii]|uniref:Uncharacterized protein n=1 Tax=[Candida] subhashii TaxID=561895 RepID=A0A8J5UJ91_9ASCO|nr:uncharacterized protein J8A68_005481 [[Candida] subhashii]KAG7660961.1 hypothetical protein J8A68_005481 [[Candida] subhashii]
MSFQTTSNTSQQTSKSKISLLSVTEFYKLDKKLKTPYLVGLFQKNQATARFISKYQKAKTTKPKTTRMINLLKQSYQEDEKLSNRAHKLFVSIAMDEDLESGNSETADTNTNQSSIEVQETVSTAIPDLTTTNPAAYTTTTAATSPVTSPAASATTVTITNIHHAAVAGTTNRHRILFTIIEEDEEDDDEDEEEEEGGGGGGGGGEDEVGGEDDDEDEEKNEIHATQGIPKSFGSKILISWYKTKTNCKWFATNYCQKIKEIWRSISKKNVLVQELCDPLAVDDTANTQIAKTKFSELGLPSDSYSISILRSIKMEQKRYGWEYPVDSYTHYLLANHPSVSSNNFEDSPKPTRNPISFTSRHSKTTNTFKQDEECEDIESCKENYLHHADFDDIEVGYRTSSSCYPSSDSIQSSYSCYPSIECIRSSSSCFQRIRSSSSVYPSIDSLNSS